MLYKSIRISVLLLIVFIQNAPIIFCQQSSYVDGLYTQIIESQSDSTTGHTYIKIAQYYVKKDQDKAKIYIDSAANIIKFKSSPLGEGLIKMAQGELKVRQKENLEALNLLEEAKSIFIKIDNPKLLKNVEYEIGAVHLGSGDYSSANANFLNSRNYASQTSDTLNQARAITALGIVQRRLGNLDQAYEYYAEALPIYIKKNHTNGHSTSLLNMAIIEKQRENFSQSEDLYKQALELALKEEPVNQSLLSYVYGNMSSLFDETKNFSKALEYGEKALEIRKKSATSEELANSYIGLAINNNHLGNYNKALSYLRLAKINAQNNENLFFQITKTESDIQYKLGKFRNAYILLSESNVHKDSIYNSEKNKQIAEINTKYETEIKETEIKRLELEDQLNSTKISQQKYTIGGLGLGLCIVSLLGYMFFSQRNKISQQNKLISKSAAEKDILLREIHHRVKNNLQVVSSLLGIQGRGIKDQKAKDAIQEGRNRVQSMSLIHQNLYKKDSLTGIEMGPYIKKLSNHLLDTYQVDEGDIKIETQIDDITLDVETVVPIGLIINELISNSLKYAFPNHSNGTITIHLHESANQLLLTISDDGIGLSEDQLKAKTDTFGHSLIRAFKNKLNAEISISSDEGTLVALKIKNYKKVS